MTENLKLLINIVEKFLGTVKFGNDQIAPILGYGDLVQGAVTIKRVYYVEGLNHNLFSVGQFYDADLEVAFRKSTCFIRDLKGNELLTGSHGTDLYSITLQGTNSPNPICLMAKVTSSQAWLWHRRLSHLNFDTINLLSKNDIVVGLLKLKFIKDHLCSSCELGKAKRKSFHSKLTPSSKRRLHLLHIDLCGPMRVASINGKRYVLVIVDDYSRCTWTHFLRRMIPEPGDANCEVTVTETFHVQTDDELSDKKIKQIEADDQAIQTILLGLPKDIYAAVDKKIASNLKFLNNLQPEWSQHVTIVHQTKDLHTSDYTQLYDFLKYNQKEVDELKAKRLAKTQDPLALMANSNNPYNYLQQPMPNPEDITDPTTAMNMALTLMAKAFKLNYSTPTNNNQRISSNLRNRQIAQPEMNMGNLAGYNDVIGNQVIQNAIHNPRVQNIRNQNGLIGVQGNANQNQIGNGNLVAARAEGNASGQNGNQIRCYNCRGVGHYSRNCTVRPRRRDAAYLPTQLFTALKEEAGIQLQVKEYDLMAAAADIDEIEEVNANCILMANL
nr:retrovirus-related Pol polyprotein from transposon TNT 1-94 [Tanacetum cinerariifolium]